LLADYVVDYGPEVWSLQYHIRQEAAGNDYWVTRPLRPSYVQLYPPEKGKPRTFMQASYPANQPAISDQVHEGAGALAGIPSDLPQTSAALAAVLRGESNKTAAAPMIDYLRAALPTLAGKGAKYSLARLDEMRGFQWLVAPPEAPTTPAKDT